MPLTRLLLLLVQRTQACRSSWRCCLYFFDTAPLNTHTTYLGVSDCFTQEVSTCFLLILSLDCHTRTQSQSEVSLEQQYSCTGSHTTVCSKLAQLTLRTRHNYADSQTHSHAGYQAYRCLSGRDREVGIRVEVRSKSKLETFFGVNYQLKQYHPLENKDKNDFTTQANYFQPTPATPINAVRVSSP